jgi:hypothetical protein
MEPLLRATSTLWRNCENSLGFADSREYAESLTHPL